MCTLNEDIFRQIVDYLSTEELRSINRAHSVFYEAWMKSRYASIRISKRDKETKRLLGHLCQPYVARHVKRLELHPWLVQPRTKSPRSLTENVIIRCMQLVDPDYTRKTAEQRLQKRLAKDTKRLTAAFTAMTELQEYSIDWDESDRFHPEFYSALLVPPLETWAQHLTTLTVRVPLSMIGSLARLRLTRLESFTYHFCTGNTPLKDIHNAHDGFVVFVNNLKDTLQALSFLSTSTSQHLDLSRMFRTLGTFPSLKKVTLSLPFDGGQLSDPMSFVGFLTRHRGSLKDFRLLTSRCAVHAKPGDPEQINWIQRILKAINKPFPLLSGVGIALRPLRAPLGTLVDFLDMHSSTIQSVSLMDRSLRMHEVVDLWPANASEGILELHVKVDALSAQLLERFARKFPNLKTLKLECNRVSIDRSCAMDVNFRHKGVVSYIILML
ncbi:hypothetical protein BDN70DRAFT_812627 [Pholiota conissans]|uniref:F-box domain-containing protein n=1 Tax=Pholiota conissans TaxID=109636 RepID=A0A9P5YV59_9AGAR|nr:hypothetical protein BDN70DRAFT_812627 [Pholiota conissans]